MSERGISDRRSPAADGLSGVDGETVTAFGRRVSVRVRGAVEGVGFRPHVCALAERLEISGWVLSDARGAEIEAQGDIAAVDRFLEALVAEAPPLATVERLEVEDLRPDPESAGAGFEVRGSVGGDPTSSGAPADGDYATCDACLAELFEPADRRHGYPFINCSNCGPSRPHLGFEMCDGCLAEYEYPESRRFNAPATACPGCGPQLRLLTPEGGLVADGPAATAATARALEGGSIVAIKGILGDSLVCLADRETAVAALRSRSGHEDEPFTLMVRDREAAEDLVDLSDADRDQLTRPARPVVVARRWPDVSLAPSVAQDGPELGVMLARNALHHLLLEATGFCLAVITVDPGEVAATGDDAAGVADRVCTDEPPIDALCTPSPPG